MVRLDTIRTGIRTALTHSLQTHGFSYDAVADQHVLDRPGLFEFRILLPVDIPDEGAATCTANLSVHCPSFEQYARESNGTDRQRPLFIRRNIGLLMDAKKWRAWEIRSIDSIDSTARRMAGAIVRYGIPWMNSFDGIEKFYRSLAENRVTDWHQLNALQRFMIGY